VLAIYTLLTFFRFWVFRKRFRRQATECSVRPCGHNSVVVQMAMAEPTFFVLSEASTFFTQLQKCLAVIRRGFPITYT